MRSLSLSEEVAQLFVLPFDGEAPHSQSEEYARYLHWVRDLRIGGLVLVNRVQNGVVRHSEPHARALSVSLLRHLEVLHCLYRVLTGPAERREQPVQPVPVGSWIRVPHHCLPRNVQGHGGWSKSPFPTFAPVS